MTGCVPLEKNSATSEDFPKPEGAEISVNPARSIATLSRICFLDRKLGDRTGGKVRERPTPAITAAGYPIFTRFGTTPKGEAFRGEKASKNHPSGVIYAGEIKDWRKPLQERREHPSRVRH